MPYISNPLQDEEKKKQQAQQNGFGVSGESTSFNQAQNSSQPQAPKPQTRSGSWVNLNQYLDANKENATAMGNKVADNVETQATKANDSINSLKSSAPGVVDKANVDDWFTNPDAAKKDQYQAFKSTGGYTGPESVDKIDKFSDYQTEVNKADSKVKDSASETGRFNLLQETYDRPQYSQGMKKLDNVLLQQNTDSKARFEDLSSKYKDILNTFNTEATNIGNQINTNIKTAAQNKNDLYLGENKAKESLLSPIQARVNQINQSNPELVKRIDEDLKDSTLNQETLDLLGLSEGQNLYNLDLNSYVNKDLSQVGLDNAATAEERAKYAALAAMIDDPTMNQISGSGKTISPVGFNRDQFNKDLTAKQSEYENANNTNIVDLGGRYIPDVNSYRGTQDLIRSATPAQIRQMIQMFESMSFDDQLRNEVDGGVGNLKNKLAEWENLYKPDRKVTKG